MKKEEINELNSFLGYTIHLRMAIQPVLIYNPQNSSHLKPEWVVKVGFKWVWGG